MATVKRLLVAFDDHKARVGFAYDPDTRIITHIGGQNQGTGTMWARVTHRTTGLSRQATFAPGENKAMSISAQGLLMDAVGDWDTDNAPFDIEASWTA